MTIRILNPHDWKKIDGRLDLLGDHERLVKIEFNCEADTFIELVHFSELPDEEGEYTEFRTFVAVIKGWEKVEVVVQAEAYFDFTSDGEVWYCTTDAVQTVVLTDEQSFTKLLSRKTRNDHLENMLRVQQQGYERLLRLQEMERLELEERLANEIEHSGANEAPVVAVASPPASSAEPAAEGGELADAGK